MAPFSAKDGRKLTCSKPLSRWIQAWGSAAGVPQLLLGFTSWAWTAKAFTLGSSSSHTDSKGCHTTSKPVPLTRITRPPLYRIEVKRVKRILGSSVLVPDLSSSSLWVGQELTLGS